MTIQVVENLTLTSIAWERWRVFCKLKIFKLHYNYDVGVLARVWLRRLTGDSSEVYCVCKNYVFFTLAMYYGKRVNSLEVPFGYDKIQQNCHQFCSALMFKKRTLQLRNSLASYLFRNVFCVFVSRFRGDREAGGAKNLAWRSTSRPPATTWRVINWLFLP